MELETRQAHALDTLLDRFGMSPFTLDEACRYMHRSILAELIERGILSTGDGTNYWIRVAKRSSPPPGYHSSALKQGEKRQS